MKFSVAYHQLDHSVALDSFIQGKVDKLDKIIESQAPVKWIIEKKGKLFNSSAKIHLFGKELYVHANSDNVYSSVSKAFDKLNEQIKNKKARIARSVHNNPISFEAV
jgi:putative sigma-54 modulation protein